jgi:hypothetical protein
MPGRRATVVFIIREGREGRTCSVKACYRTVIERGVVPAIETPAYTTGAEGTMTEDLVHLLPGGIEHLHELSHGDIS